MGTHMDYFKAILDNIPIGIIFIDERGYAVYKNRKARNVVCKDISKTKILENPLIKESSYFKELGNLLKKGKPFKEIIWKKNNNFFSVDGISLPDGGAIVIMNDVSERLYAENALREKEEKYRVLTESSPAGILMVKNGICTFSNRRFEEITGYDSSISGKKIVDFLHTGDIKLVREKMEDALNGKSVPSCTTRLIKRNNELVWVELDVCAVNQGNGNELLINMVNITNKKIMEDELEISNKKMEEIIEREKKFIEDISHYFFNPLCIAKGYIDLSMNGADTELKRKLEITRTAVNRVETVVKHVVMEGRIYE